MHHVCLRAMSHPGALGEPLRSQQFLHSGHKEKSHGDFISWGNCFWYLPIFLLATESMARSPQELRKHKLCSSPLGSNTGLGFAETCEQDLPVSYQLPGLHSSKVLTSPCKNTPYLSSKSNSSKSTPNCHTSRIPLCQEPRSCLGPREHRPGAGGAARGPSGGKHPCFPSPVPPSTPRSAASPRRSPSRGSAASVPSAVSMGVARCPGPREQQRKRISYASSCVLLHATGNEAKPAFGQSQKHRALLK